MSKKKIIFFVVVLFMSLSMAVSAFAISPRASSVYFSKGKSFQMTGNFQTEIYATTKAVELVGTPIVNVKCQKKVLMTYNTGASMDVTISNKNQTYYAIFDAESSGTFRLTWKQTNDYASMTANLDAYSK